METNKKSWIDLMHIDCDTDEPEEDVVMNEYKWNDCCYCYTDDVDVDYDQKAVGCE